MESTEHVGNKIIIAGNVQVFGTKLFDVIELSKDTIIDRSGVSKIFVIGMDFDDSAEEHGVRSLEYHENTNKPFFKSR
jgi:hypothetical protein